MLMRMRAREERARLGVVGLPNEDEPPPSKPTTDAVRMATTSDAIADAKRSEFQSSPFHSSTLASALPAAPQVGPSAHLDSDEQGDRQGYGLDCSVGLDQWWGKPASGRTPRGYSKALRSASYSRRSMANLQPAAAVAKPRHRPAIDEGDRPVPIWERLNRTSWGRRRVHHERNCIDGSLATHGRYVDGSHQSHDREDASRPSRGLPYWSKPAALAASRSASASSSALGPTPATEGELGRSPEGLGRSADDLERSADELEPSQRTYLDLAPRHPLDPRHPYDPIIADPRWRPVRWTVPFDRTHQPWARCGPTSPGPDVDPRALGPMWIHQP